MTMARSQLVDLSVTRWYHCMTKCVRGADLLANACEDRKAWIEQRLQELAQIFAVGVGGSSVIGEKGRGWGGRRGGGSGGGYGENRSVGGGHRKKSQELASVKTWAGS